jgi:hypothetical protein
LTSWIVPAKVAEAARKLAFDRPKAIARQWHSFGTNLEERASHTGLDRLITEWINGFRLSLEYVELVRWLFRDVGQPVPDAAWRELVEVSWSGKLLFSDFPVQVPPNTVVAYSERRVIADIVEDPVRLLIHANARMADTWLAARRSAGRAFLQQSADGPLFAYMEALTAIACGAKPSAIEMGYGPPRPGTNFRFRTITWVGPLDDNTDRIGEAVDVAGDWWSAMRTASLPISALERLPRADGAFTNPRPTVPVRKSAKRSSPLDVDALTGRAGTGLKLVGRRSARQPWRNLERFRNEISPFARVRHGAPITGDRLLVDPFYGQGFDFVPVQGAAVYGATDAFPWLLEEAFASLGWLRVPYRRIPRIRVASKEQIVAAVEIGQSIIQVDPLLAGASPPLADRLVFRGQPKEYYLKRDPAVRSMLYGDARALEPSLLASATRRNVDVDAVMPEWCAIIGTFWDECISQLSANWNGDRSDLNAAIDIDLRRRATSFDLRLVALSYAQHYGLASVGLDVTSDLDVAIFFALHEATHLGGMFNAYRRRPRSGNDSVLYVFVPFERFLLDHERYQPRCFPTGRPDSQQAHSMHSGWGLNENACARNLLVALYLAPDGDYGPMPAIETLFPGPDDDDFGAFLFELIVSQPPAHLKRFLGDFSWVLPAR